LSKINGKIIGVGAKPASIVFAVRRSHGAAHLRLWSSGGVPDCVWCVAKYDQVNPPALKRLIANGAQLRAFSSQIMEACYKAAKELHSDIAKTNESFKKVYESMEAFQGAAYPWFGVAEFNYDSFMIRHLA